MPSCFILKTWSPWGRGTVVSALPPVPAARGSGIPGTAVGAASPAAPTASRSLREGTEQEKKHQPQARCCRTSGEPQPCGVLPKSPAAQWRQVLKVQRYGLRRKMLHQLYEPLPTVILPFVSLEPKYQALPRIANHRPSEPLLCVLKLNAVCYSN